VSCDTSPHKRGKLPLFEKNGAKIPALWACGAPPGIRGKNRKPGQCRVFKKLSSEEFGSALTGLHPWVLLVDDVDPAMATHDAAIFVASFRGLQGVTDLHHKLSVKMLK